VLVLVMVVMVVLLVLALLDLLVFLMLLVVVLVLVVLLVVLVVVLAILLLLLQLWHQETLVQYMPKTSHMLFLLWRHKGKLGVVLVLLVLQGSHHWVVLQIGWWPGSSM
jgi:hypothetical protein